MVSPTIRSDTTFRIGVSIGVSIPLIVGVEYLYRVESGSQRDVGLYHTQGPASHLVRQTHRSIVDIEHYLPFGLDVRS